MSLFRYDLRALRLARGWSLAGFEKRTGIKGVVLGSYERGDRTPSVDQMDKLLRHFGKKLAIVDAQDGGVVPVRTTEEIANELELIARQIRKDPPD